MKPAAQVNRRNFLYRAIQLAAATQLLSACGGGGGGGGSNDSEASAPEGLTPLSGQVQLPANLSLAGTRVLHLLGEKTVAASGAFRVDFIADSIALTQVRDAAGNLLLFGFLRAEQTTLSTRRTVEALVYRALGIWAHAPRIRVAALSLLRGENLTAIEAAISSAIAAAGAAWTTSGMAGVGTAVKAKVTALIGTPPAALQSRKSALGMIVTPGERVSGLIVEGDGIGACKVTNDFRRRSLLVHTEVAAKLESGPEFVLAENLVKTEMTPTDGLSSPLQAIADLFFERKTYYTPVSVTLATPRFPNTAIYTKYKVYAVGPGSALGDWNGLPQPVKEAGLVLIFRSIVLDFVVPFLASVVVFIKAEDIDELARLAEASDVLKDVVNGLAKLPDLIALLLKGDFAGCCEATANYIRNTDSVQIACTAALAAILETLFGPYVVDKKTGLVTIFEKDINAAWSAIDKFFDTGEFALTLFDSAVQVLDIASSYMGEPWDVTVTQAKVSLSPLEFFVEKNALFSGITAVSVDVRQVEGKVLGYTWKCGSGHLSDGHKYGSFIDSTTVNSVAYDAVGVAAGTVDQVDVKVFLSGFGTDDPVGSAKAKVYVTGLTVSPTETKPKANESVTLTAQTVGMRPLAAGESVTCRWLMNSTAGVLTAGQTSTATFRADATKQGLAFVTVEAFLGEKRIGSAQATLTVGTKLVVTGRVFEDHWKDASGCHTGMYIAFPKVKGATSYDVFVSGMRGYFGAEYHWYVSVNAAAAPSSPWTDQGAEILGGMPRGGAILGAGNGGGDTSIAAVDQRWPAWYEGSTVEVTATL